MTTKRWIAAFLAAFLILMGACGALVFAIDPFFHYHAPDPENEVWFDQRRQTAGLLRSQSYETVFMGSSLAANFRPAWFDNLYQTKTVKVTFPNGGFREFDTALQYAFTKQSVSRVIFGADPNLLARSPQEEPYELPDYLYNDDPLDDGQYLFNKDVLLRSGYAAWKKLTGQGESLQDAFMRDGKEDFDRATALFSYERPERADTVLPADALLENAEANLAVVTGWVESHPDVEFIIYFSPYSILFWDKMDRLGETEAMFTMLDRVTARLLQYDNVELQFFMDETDWICDLDNYADHIHAAGRVTYAMAEAMPKGTYRMTEENRTARLRALQDFAESYDYEAIWEDKGD